jgi:hypothetical protein
MREIAYQTIRIGVTSFLMSNSKKIWPHFLVHIGNYSILNGQHARKEVEALQDLCLCLGSAKGHDPHELAVSHVRYMGLNHSNIYVVDFDEDKFKGVFFYEEVLQKFPDDASRKELQVEQEEMKKFHQDQFLRFLQEDQNKLITKEQEKIKKYEELE